LDNGAGFDKNVAENKKGAFSQEMPLKYSNIILNMLFGAHRT